MTTSRYSPRRTATQLDYADRIGRVLEHVRANLDSSLDLDELARLSGFSPFHFHRVFRGLVGEPVKAHIRRLRLERAARSLRCPDDASSVTDLAFDAGFETTESFTKAFRRHFGLSPTEFRSARTPLPSTSFRPDFPMPEDVPVELAELPELTFAKIVHRGPYQGIAPLWERLMAWAGPAGIFGPTTRVFGRYFDDPESTPPEELRSEACITVTGEPQLTDGIVLDKQKAGRFAKHTHLGPYENLPETYGKLLGQWIPTLDVTLAEHSPCVEIYLNSPVDTAPEALLTEIYVPLKN